MPAQRHSLSCPKKECVRSLPQPCGPDFAGPLSQSPFCDESTATRFDRDRLTVIPWRPRASAQDSTWRQVPLHDRRCTRCRLAVGGRVNPNTRKQQEASSVPPLVCVALARGSNALRTERVESFSLTPSARRLSFCVRVCFFEARQPSNTLPDR